ncbi:hypothetical protein BGZ59_008404 [Podila verticillata]|nr:hypothetical protein BGZ59_008404 [Podila verticillata]KFH73348.1 hypothetical protein MVEG_00564 [Podila verticillata NRRL 6337]
MKVQLESMGSIRRAHEHAQSVIIPRSGAILPKRSWIISVPRKRSTHTSAPTSTQTMPRVVQDALSNDKYEDKYEDLIRYLETARKALSSILNGAVLTTTLAHLVEFQAAVDSPTRPSRLMSGGRFMPPVSSTKCSKLAQVCALKLMKTPEVVEELLHLYEGQGYGEQLTDLVEASLGSEGRNTDLFTDTSLFAEALIDYLKMYWERINTPKIIRICEETHLWTELVFLNVCYDLIRPDSVMELAWCHGMHDVAMPYMVQVTRQFMATIEMLEEKVQEIDALKKKVQEFENKDNDKERGETIEPKASFQPTMNRKQ